MLSEGSMRCPNCNKELIISKFKYPNTDISHNVGCPACDCVLGRVEKGTDDYLVNLKPDESKNPNCPKCGNKMRLKDGRYGEFWSCKSYPNCSGTRNKDYKDNEEYYY
jgi:ssDNA-binding Zn-finger/Zn-ribbon topoisomerase 1